jgi:chemotaxis protein CheD
MSTPERQTLAQRMESARLRAAQARAPAPGAPAAKAGAAHHGPSWQVVSNGGDHLNLMPGQMHFGNRAASLRTLLGSCLAVTLWHPTRKLGGMCHFLLPTRQRKPGEPLDGRYGDEALEAMVTLLRTAGTEPSEYHAHLYGGADTMPEGSALKFNVGERNIEQGFSLVDRYGFEIQGVDVGEDVPRNVTLTLQSGEVEMRRGTGKAPLLQMPQHPTRN